MKLATACFIRDTLSAFDNQILCIELHTVCVGFQELGELREAKQLLIQQKLELQGQVEAAQKTLEQEQKEHEATKDSRTQREEQLLAHTRDIQDQLVRSLAKSHQMIVCIKYLSLALSILFRDMINASSQRWQRRRQEKSR